MPTSVRTIGRGLVYLARIARDLRGTTPKECPCCGYTGRFRAFGYPPRYDARCPSCDSLERHRLLTLLNQRHGFLRSDTRILHFAPEPQVRSFLRKVSRGYESADLQAGRADHRENIEALSFSDESFDHIVCVHVLEHVDDGLALRELFRVLKPGGALVAMVPIIEGWDVTYEDPKLVDAAARALHFGQDDHVRIYGRDFRDRVREAGFLVEELAADGADAVRYGLTRGEKVFVCKRPL